MTLEAIPAATIDKIMAIDFIEYIVDSDFEQTLAAAWCVLWPLGRLAICTPCATDYFD